MGNVKIYRTKVRNAKKWVADVGRVNGKRKRRFFDTKEEALAELEAVELQRKTAGDVWLGLTASERVEAATIIGEAKARGVTLREVWNHFLDSRDSIVKEPLSMGDAVERFLAAKRGALRRPAYLEGLTTTVKAFSRGRERLPVHKVTTEDVEAFVGSMSATWSKKGAVKRLGTFFGYCIKKGFAVSNPIHGLEVIQIERETPEILTVRQAARVMAKARREYPEALAALALGMFAGVRPHELRRLKWDALKLDEGLLFVDAAAAKTSDRRIVHLEPAAVGWLKLARESSAVLPMTLHYWRKSLGGLADFMGWPRWSSDVLRHTAASYLLAEKRDAAAVALELGNSVPVLFRHYRELVTRKDAARFWRLVPRKFRVPESPAADSRRPPSSSRTRQPATS